MEWWCSMGSSISCAVLAFCLADFALSYKCYSDHWSTRCPMCLQVMQYSLVKFTKLLFRSSIFSNYTKLPAAGRCQISLKFTVYILIFQKSCRFCSVPFRNLSVLFSALYGDTIFLGKVCYWFSVTQSFHNEWKVTGEMPYFPNKLAVALQELIHFKGCHIPWFCVCVLCVI